MGLDTLRAARVGSTFAAGAAAAESGAWWTATCSTAGSIAVSLPTVESNAS